jgi:hypothetical protein
VPGLSWQYLIISEKTTLLKRQRPAILAIKVSGFTAEPGSRAEFD